MLLQKDLVILVEKTLDLCFVSAFDGFNHKYGTGGVKKFVYNCSQTAIKGGSY